MQNQKRTHSIRCFAESIFYKFLIKDSLFAYMFKKLKPKQGTGLPVGTIN